MGRPLGWRVFLPRCYSIFIHGYVEIPWYPLQDSYQQDCWLLLVPGTCMRYEYIPLLYCLETVAMKMVCAAVPPWQDADWNGPS